MDRLAYHFAADWRAGTRARSPDQAGSLQSSAASTSLTEAQDLGLTARVDSSPIRLRRNGRQSFASGLYFSVKCGRHLPYESRLELHDLWHAEVRTDVVASWPQPFTLHYMHDGKRRRYTPDRKDVLADGATEIVEIRGDGRRRGGDRDDWAAVAALLATRGWAFRIRRRAEIEGEPTFSAVEAVQRHRRTRVQAEHVAAAEQLLSKRPSTFGQLSRTLATGPSGIAITCALVIRRIVSVDLTEGLHDGAEASWIA